MYRFSWLMVMEMYESPMALLVILYCFSHLGLRFCLLSLELEDTTSLRLYRVSWLLLLHHASLGGLGRTEGTCRTRVYALK